MELVFQKNNLADAIQIAQSVSAGRTTLPILANVLVKAEDDRIEMTGTDLEVSINMTVEGEVKEAGSITLPAKKLSEIVRGLPNEPIRLVTTANDRVEITCGQGQYKIIGLAEEEFPKVPTELEDYFTIKGGNLVKMLEQTEFAAATDESRYFLNGVYFKLAPDETTFVATDSRRLATAEGKDMDAIAEEVGVIVPLKAVEAIQKAFAEGDEVKVGLVGNQILFRSDTTVLVSRLIEGEYPNYKDVIPTDNNIHIELDTQKLLGVLQRVASLSNPKTNMITFQVEDGQVIVSAETPQVGEAKESLAIDDGDGNLLIGFDARFFIDALKHIDAEGVLLELNDSQTATVIHPSASSGDWDCTYLIMPMRLDD